MFSLPLVSPNISGIHFYNNNNNNNIKFILFSHAVVLCHVNVEWSLKFITMQLSLENNIS